MPDVDIIGYGSKHSHEFKLYLNEWSTDASTNTSTLGFEFSIYKSSYSWYGANNITWSLTINGTSYTGSIPDYTAGNRLSLINSSMTIPHNDDGTKTISAYFSVYDGSGRSYACGDASASGSLTLSTIPRYMDVYASERSKTYNSISVNWSSTSASDWTKYSLNGGAWTNAGDTVASDHKSGYFTITGLTENTTYTVKVASKRADSQLWCYSNTISITTNTASISIATYNIDFGEDAQVVLTNLGNYPTTLVGEINSTEIINQSISTGTNVIEWTDEQLTDIFKEYGDISQSNTVTMTLTATATNGSTSTATMTITFTGDRATVWINDSGTWKKGIVWAKDNGTWKKGIAWKGENGTWKKAL